MEVKSVAFGGRKELYLNSSSATDSHVMETSLVLILFASSPPFSAPGGAGSMGCNTRLALETSVGIGQWGD